MKTIRQSRRTLRQKAAASDKHNFSRHILDPKIVIRRDGKLLPDSTGCQSKYNRLPVLVSYNGTEKLLAVPKLTS